MMNCLFSHLFFCPVPCFHPQSEDGDAQHQQQLQDPLNDKQQSKKRRRPKVFFCSSSSPSSSFSSKSKSRNDCRKVNGKVKVSGHRALLSFRPDKPASSRTHFMCESSDTAFNSAPMTNNNSKRSLNIRRTGKAQSLQSILLKQQSSTCLSSTEPTECSSLGGDFPCHAHANCTIDGLCSDPQNSCNKCSSKDVTHLHLGSMRKKEIGSIRATRSLQYAYLSNHVVVNQERRQRGLPLLTRCSALDAAAKEKAESMAQRGRFLPVFTSPTLVEHVQRGPSLQIIHQLNMFGVDPKPKRLILGKKYHTFGMGAARSQKDGMLYVCQLFQTTTTTGSSNASMQDHNYSNSTLGNSCSTILSIEENKEEEEAAEEDDSEWKDVSSRSQQIKQLGPIPSLRRGPSLRQFEWNLSQEDG